MLLPNGAYLPQPNLLGPDGSEEGLLRGAPISSSPPPVTFPRQIGPIATCSHDKAYMAILITIIPLGLLLTVLIVLALLAFHKSIKATKIYDNCTSQSANYVYHLEIRTGDTSAAYNRRKATLTIDMFDENQMTLARIAVPGHVIFGRKESPVECTDDERFAELRVTRLWLYRATRLRRVATLRLTHTCNEPEARIMIYGVELLTDEERHRLFFPVMSYITAYGAVGRPNACFDPDPIGTISLMGQYPESATISDHLTQLDYAILVFFFCALVLYLSTNELFPGSFRENAQAVYKGAILGSLCFAVAFVAGVFLRYAIKHHYSLNVGRGFWSLAYYAFEAILLATSLTIWVYTTFLGYKIICSNHFGLWLVTICVAVTEAVGFAIMCATIAWMMVGSGPVYAEQFVLPDEPGGGGGGGGGAGGEGKTDMENAPGTSAGRVPRSGRPARSPGADMPTTSEHHALQRPGMGAQMAAWQTAGGTSAQPLLMGVSHHQQPQNQHHVGPGYQHGTNLYGQPQPGPYMMMPPQPQPMGLGVQNNPYKVANFAPPAQNYQPYGPQSPYYGQGQTSPIAGTAAGPQQPQPQAPTQQQQPPHPSATPPTVFHTMQLSKPQGFKQLGAGANTTTFQTYGQQTTTTKQATGKSGKTGSNDSTGSTYYQQLMKNKGGVKSISQYGELLKRNKK